MGLRSIITASVSEGEDGYYIAECLDIPVFTQGRTIDETVSNLREAVSLHLEDEDLAALGFTEHPVVLITMEVEPAVA